MEVIKKEEPLQKTWEEQLADNVVKADKLAQQIKEKVLLPQFTLIKMAELMRIPRTEAEARIKFLSRFGYVENKHQGGVMFYRIISDPKERIKGIEETSVQVQAQFNGQMDYFQALQEITTNYISDEPIP